MTILLVDDDTGVLQALLAILKSAPGHEVRVATSGEKALAHAEAHGVDLLITDVVMEPMDGFTLRDELVSRFPAMRTILISGYDLSDYPLQTEAHQLLAKPIEAEELLAAIAREVPPEPEPEAEPVPQPAPVRAGVAGLPVPTAVKMESGVRAVAVAAGPGVPVAKAQPVAVPVARSTAAGSGVRAVAVAVPAATPSTAVPAAAAASSPRASAVSPAVPVARATAVAPVVEETPPFPEPEKPAAAESAGSGLIGQTIGTYQILSLLGEGRWGAVYAAVQISINRPVGLKVLDPARLNDATATARFIADARAKAHVQHPSILAVYEAGEADGHIFYAHEYVDGQNMAELRASGEKLDEPTALRVLRVAAEGLAYLQLKNIPHKAPEATSVFLGVDRHPRLANLATQLGDEQLPTEQEIQTLGRIILGVLPAIQSLSPGLQELVKRMVQSGPQGLSSWGQLLQGLKALEPKVVPVEAAKISAQDRAAIAAVEQARKHQKRSLYVNLAIFGGSIVLIAALAWHFLVSNERTLDDQVQIPAGEFLFANGEPLTLPDFWIDKYEVTYGQYAKFLEFLKKNPTIRDFDHPRQPPMKIATNHKPDNWEIFYGHAKIGKAVHSVPIDLNCPMMEVDFWDAYAYAKWKGRELPTEQEWEKAARGTRGLPYPWGEQMDAAKVNSNADYNEMDPAAKGKVDGFNYWNPVDAVKGDKGPFGVIGMAGNVREWTATWDATNKHPIIKGGSFMSTDVRLDQRADKFPPGTVSESLGFRTVSHTAPQKK